MFCNQETDQKALYEMKQKLKTFVDSTLSDQYELELSLFKLSPANIDNLLFTIPTYTYTERNDNLKLCVIQNTLIYTFLDDTFDSPYIRYPHKIWCLTRVPDHRPSTPIKFKNSIRKLPILRSSYQNQKGLLVTDFRHTLQYHQVHTWEATGSEHTGFKDRKNSLQVLQRHRGKYPYNPCHLNKHSRNRIMGHIYGRTFAHYISIMDDTQSIFIETSARKSLLSVATYTSIMRNLSAPQQSTDAQKNTIELNTQIADWENKCRRLRTDSIVQFGRLKAANELGDPRSKQLQKLQNQIKSRRKRLCDAARRDRRADFFPEIGNRIIESNQRGEHLTFTPDDSRI
ncbi:uncharacterized protein N7469_004335 [Penicillium citrinum]|uniref:Uncharacterized protein n=1 Tax=Penicillium citrinum TaxID=5077 RepID=A0A9W9P701_PENCI|nr:uncharacterized protein N7469_004335 [Penicillium citrinum]KAJ5235167.1 hypothetical protein N7469_004335 [Penicillium citrinum]